MWLLCALVGSKGSFVSSGMKWQKLKMGKEKEGWMGRHQEERLDKGWWLAYDRRRKMQSPWKPQYSQPQWIMPRQAEINKGEEWGVSMEGKITSALDKKNQKQYPDSSRKCLLSTEARLKLRKEVRAKGWSESIQQTSVELLETRPWSVLGTRLTRLFLESSSSELSWYIFSTWLGSPRKRVKMEEAKGWGQRLLERKV